MILIILMLFSKQARGRPGARENRVGDPCFSVSLGWLVPVPRLGKKGLVKGHMSARASEALNAPSYYTTLIPNDSLQDPNFCNKCKP